MGTPAGGRRLRLATGLATTISDDGEGTPPVLLLHGWAGSRRSFAALLPLLSRHTRVVAVDLRGHGNADKPPAGYDLASLAEDVVATLDAVGISSAVLVGASSGGYLAQQVAVSAPQRVAGLVLAGSPRDLRGRPPFADELDLLRDPVDPAWVRSFTAGFTDLDRLPSWYVDVMVEDGLRLPAAIWKASLQGLITSPPPTDVGDVRAPTLVISGGRDSLLGADQTTALVAAIAGAQWIEYPDTGHLVLEEQPAELAADVLAFVAGLPGTRQS
jgi:pimeloyl-ACP methyl ester carboxylesterase